MKVLFVRILLLGLPFVCTGCFTVPPDPKAERIEAARTELYETVFAQSSPSVSLTLEDAISYALENNLSIRAAELEYAIEHEVQTASALKMLPSLQANIGLSERNRYSASSSMSMISGRQSLEPSFSSERNSKPSDLSMVWSLMDFGLSYIKTRQASEREAMAGQNLRRIRQQIAMDTAIAYYRLCAAEDIAEMCASLEDAVRIQLEVFKAQVGKRNMSRNEANRRSLPLLQGLKLLRDLSKERQTARINLAKAMGVQRPADLVVARDQEWTASLPVIGDSFEPLYELALTSRPEMFRADASARISQLEAKSALLQIAPNVNFSASLHYNPDKFVVYHNWMEAGVRASWDLLRIPAKIRDAKTAKQRAELSQMRVNVAAASVLVQVHLSLLELDEAKNKLELLNEIVDTRREMLESVEENVSTGRGHSADALIERIRYLNDYANSSWGRSDYLAAYARLKSSLGVDPDSDIPVPPVALAASGRATIQ